MSLVPVGSISVTAMAFGPVLRVLLSVTGKSGDVVVPVIATSPEVLIAIMPPLSAPLPPMKVRYTREFAPEADGSIFATKKSVAPPPGPTGLLGDSGNVDAEVVVPPT